jgi:hypothetical protein
MCLIYIATGVPKVKLLILGLFRFLGIFECTAFCAVVHSFLCKKERSDFLIGGVTGFREGFYVFGDG